jgi:putative glutamine amidotransferase
MAYLKPMIGINSFVQIDEKHPASDLNARDFYKVPAKYIDAVAAAGGIPVIVPCLGNKPLLRDYLVRLDGFLFIGGADLPPELYRQVRHPNVLATIPVRRAETDMFLVSAALKLNIPILGICLGCQLLNVAAGGELIQHLETTDRHRCGSGDVYHKIKIKHGSKLMNIFGSAVVTVNSAHHQAVKPGAVGSGFSPVAYAPDGTIEAIEMKDRRFVMGVQWHPERIADEESRRKIFSAFIAACRLSDNILNMEKHKAHGIGKTKKEGAR